MKRILVTGSRDWTDEGGILIAIIEALHTLGHVRDEEVVIVHGAARGADTLAGIETVQCGFRVEAHPADWRAHGKAAGPIRNAEMVRLGAHVCLAFPQRGSVGTWDCVRRAEAAGIPVVVTRG